MKPIGENKEWVIFYTSEDYDEEKMTETVTTEISFDPPGRIVSSAVQNRLATILNIQRN